MAAKTTDWRPGPTVCRCCLSEGCYKDISTEYFWMGKREVYSEMLSETLSLSIAYSTSGGPNSNSRLICEPCISRLRDASDFKRQVQECEKTFMQYLDPGSEPLSDFDETRIEVPIESLETQVKVEQVKTEKDDASDGDFEDRADFLDDDEDDLDDQPLTRLATKIPKKESVDLLDLLESKPAEKRKSTTKAKAGPAKKAKTKKEVVKATSSKATKQTEKKKKGDARATDVPTGDTDLKLHSEVYLRDLALKKVGRQSAIALIHSTNMCPFRFNGSFMCLYCISQFGNMSELTQHVESEHNHVTEEDIRKGIIRIRKYQPVKVNVLNFGCKLCNKEMYNFEDLKHHLIGKHNKPIDLTNYGVWPHNITEDEQFNCVLCGLNLDNYRTLNKHIIEHYAKLNENKGNASSEGVCLHTSNTVVKNNEKNLSDREKNKICRTSAIAIIHNTNVCPFRFNGSFMCLYCPSRFSTMSELAQHVENNHAHVNAGEIRKAIVKLRKYKPIKINMMNFGCKLCDDEILSFDDLKFHLKGKHNKPVDFVNDGVWPYKIVYDEYNCVLCGIKFEDYRLLNKHIIIEHYSKSKNNKGDAIVKTKCVRVRTRVANMNSDTYLRELEQKKISRDSAIALIHSTNVCPFKYSRFFMCLYCSSRYVNMSELAEHVELQHKHVTPGEIRKAIIRIHCYKPIKVNVLDYGCKLCNDEISNFEDLKNHLIGKHKKPIDLTNDGVWPYKITETEFICLLCEKKFEHFWLLNRHINEHYTKFICDQCGTGFASDLRLKTHISSHVVGSYPCDECGKVFNSSMLRQQHVERVHRKIKKHKCLYCTETFREYNHKQRHLRTVHGVKMRNYRCNFCPKVFDSTSGVRSHERYTHLKTRKYRCDVCDYACAVKTMLTDHMFCHSDKKNFQCQVCKKAYPRKKSLVEHMKIHNNIRRFVCQHCDKAFIQKCSLKGHMKTHHKEFLM